MAELPAGSQSFAFGGINTLVEYGQPRKLQVGDERQLLAHALALICGGLSATRCPLAGGAPSLIPL